MKRTSFLFLSVLLSCLFSPFVKAQSESDTVKAINAENVHDTVKILKIAEIGEQYTVLRIGFWDSLRNNAEKWEMNRTIAQCLNNIGYVYDEMGETLKALDYYNQGLRIREQTGDKHGIAESLNNIALIYEHLGDILNALDVHFRGLKIQEEIGDKPGMALSFNNIGHIYQEQDDIPNALEYYNRCLVIATGINSPLRGTALNNLGNLYRTMAFTGISSAQRKDSLLILAEEHFQKSLEIFREIEDNEGVATLLQNLGRICQDRNDIPGAKEYYDQSLSIWESLDNKDGIFYVLNNFGGLYLEEGKIIEAQVYGLKSLRVGQELGYPFNISLAADLMKDIYQTQGNWKKAFEMLDLYYTMTDSVNNEATRKASVRTQFQHEYDKKEALLKVEQEKERAVAEEKSRKQKILIKSIVSGLLLVIIFAVFIYRSLRVTRKQKKIIEIKNAETESQKLIIEEKNKNITDSITYAKRIQQAKLPVKEEIILLFPQSFILFKPKDIVSGDFYFFRRINGITILAAADCTGHGVPGAFMSLIGSEKLEEAISLSTDTSLILKHLNNGIRSSLHQSESKDSTRDGMDIALCAVDLENNFLNYAGANRPAWIIRKGQKDIEEILPTKLAIGGYTEADQQFETHNLNFQSGDTFYIFSDGYADTYSFEGKKLKTRKFKDILTSIQDIPMKEQEKYLDDYIESWKAGAEQVDDILIIGVRF